MELSHSPPRPQENSFDSTGLVLSPDALEFVSKSTFSILQEVLYVNGVYAIFIHRHLSRFKRRVVVKCYPAQILYMVSMRAVLM